MTPPKKTGTSPLSAQVAEESAQAHRIMRRQFESIERAVRADQFHEGARLLEELINAAREHFTNEEVIAQSGGKMRSAGGSLMHKVFIERARTLQDNCLNASSSEDKQNQISNKLVLLLSDMVESDIRIQKRIDDTPDLSVT